MRNQVKFLIGIVVLLFAAAGCASATVEPTAVPTEAADTMDNMDSMGDGEHSAEQFAPLVGGIYEDGPVSFIHTETSDESVAT
ncbi:MAG: hypothetical protein ACE5FD_09040, partial [Anaerolineae bacterium]